MPELRVIKMSKAEQSTAVAVLDSMVLAERPDWMNQDAARGSENVSSNDIIIPRIEIIQQLSPQHNKKKPEYIEGAEAGMAFNTGSSSVYAGPILFIPVYFTKEWLLWRDIKKGGGFGGSFQTEELANAAKVAQEIPNEWEVVDTYIHFVMVLKAGSTLDKPMFEEAVLSMSKSQAKVSRNFNTLVKMAGGDRFSRIYQLDVVDDQNKEGQDYFNWKVIAKGFVSKPMFEAAERLYTIIKSGERKVAHAEATPQQATRAEKTVSAEQFDDDMGL